MKTLFIPLDERPCNYNFPLMIAQSNQQIELVEPDKSFLGHKKKPAQVEYFKQFIDENIEGCDNCIISIDMIVYGGLIPSRLHYLSETDALQRLELIKYLKQLKPQIKIYAYHCIMRAPSYNSSEEEPDYYENYGFALFRRKYLLDLKKRHGLNQKEKDELLGIDIPQEIITDYEQRRLFNTKINLKVIDFLEAGYLDFLVIPQDDSSPYGYTAISQKIVINALKEKRLDQKVTIYPGADEVGLSLLARAYHEYYHLEPKVYPFYASVLGPMIIPKYEDRPMYESLKSHVRVCKAKLVNNPQDADVVLAINSPGKIMQEAFIDKNDLDVTYTSYRYLLAFAEQIQDYINSGYRVALCDSAFSNGGDLQLIEYLDELNILDQLVSYAGWNTNCNSLGTTLSQAFIGQENVINNLCYRLIEDVFYQAIVRKEVVENDLPHKGLSYYDFKDQQTDVENIIKKKLQTNFGHLHLSQRYPFNITKIYMPWKRMFEIRMEIKL